MNTKTNALSMVSKTGLTSPKEQLTNTYRDNGKENGHYYLGFRV